MYAYLQLLVVDYLRSGGDIALFNSNRIPTYSVHVPIVKRDLYTIGLNKSLIYCTNDPPEDIMYWFYDSRGVAKERDTDLLRMIDPRKCVNSPGGVLGLYDHTRLIGTHEGSKNGQTPYISGDDMTLKGLMEIGGNSISQFFVFNYKEVEDRIIELDSRRPLVKYYDHAVKPLEMIRMDQDPHIKKMMEKQNRYSIRFDGKSDYSNSKVVKYGFGCNFDISEEMASMPIDLFPRWKEDIMMIVFIDV